MNNKNSRKQILYALLLLSVFSLSAIMVFASAVSAFSPKTEVDASPTQTTDVYPDTLGLRGNLTMNYQKNQSSSPPKIQSPDEGIHNVLQVDNPQYTLHCVAIDNKNGTLVVHEGDKLLISGTVSTEYGDWELRIDDFFYHKIATIYTKNGGMARDFINLPYTVPSLSDLPEPDQYLDLEGFQYRRVFLDLWGYNPAVGYWTPVKSDFFELNVLPASTPIPYYLDIVGQSQVMVNASNAFKIQLLDQQGNPVNTVLTNYVVDLANSQGAWYQDEGCNTPISTVKVNQLKSSSSTIYFAPNAIGSATLRASTQWMVPRQIDVDVKPRRTATFGLNGLGSDYNGTVITLDGTNYTYNDFGKILKTWLPNTTHTITATEIAAISESKRYFFTGWTNGGDLTSPNGTYTMPDLNTTITLNYKTQYFLTVNGGPGTVGGGGWYDSGETAYATVPSLIQTFGPNRYTFNGWIGDASGAGTPSIGITIDSPKTVNATWLTDYQVTFSQTGLNASASANTVLTVHGVTYDYANLPSALWLPDGTAFSWTNIVPWNSSQRFGLTSHSGLTSPIHAGGTDTATYVTQIQNTFAAGGLSSPNSVDVKGTCFGVADQTIVTLNSVNRYHDSNWTDINTSVTFPAISKAGGNNERWALTSPYTATLTAPSGMVSPPQNYSRQERLVLYLTGISGTDYFVIKGTYCGVANSTVASLNSSNSFNTECWSDYGANITWPATSQGSNASERWYMGQPNGNQMPVSTGGIAISGVPYFHQYYLAVLGGYNVTFGTGSRFSDQWYDAKTNTTVSSNVIFNRTNGVGNRVYAWQIDKNPAININTNAGTVTTTAINMSTSHTVTFATTAQYQVSFQVTGLDSNTGNGTVLTVGSNTYIKTQLPISNLWVDNQTAFSWASSVSGAGGTSYMLGGHDFGLTSPIDSTGVDTADYIKFGGTQQNPPQTYTINVLSEHGNPSASGNVSSGGSFTASVSETDGINQMSRWVCTGYSVDGGPATSGSRCSFTNVTASHTVSFFWQKQHQIIVKSEPSLGGSTTPNAGNIWVNDGILELSARPNSGYNFSGWTSDCATFGAQTSTQTYAQISQPCTITATFTATGTQPTPTAMPPKTAPETVTATDTSNNKTCSLTLNGNVTAQQICNLTLTANAKNLTATLTFNVTGQDGATGFCNITVPKTAIPNGLKPEVYVDGQLIEAQGYCEDRENYYVWWTVHFSSHTVVFQFTATPSTTGMFEWWALVLPLSAAAAVGLTAVYTRRRKRN